jgi:decaprenylphospho-beta-D-erythro-pentofuranosid-2-ulose 2-reductase
MKILIIGATSAIAKATARLYAARHAQLFLIGRNEDLLIELKEDLTIRGAQSVASHVLDLSKQKDHREAIEQARISLEEIDIALLCHGSLPDQEACESDYKKAEREINVNGLSVISLCTEISKVLKAQQSGVLAVITSVAGDRGRQPNFIYGAAKSMVSTYLQGLRGKLLAHKVHVVDIRPGLVDTPMTAKFDKGLLWSTPELVANKIVRSIDNRRHTVYVPGYWRIIMATVCSIPEFIFKRLKI